MLVRLLSATAHVYRLLVGVVELIRIVAFYLPVFSPFGLPYCFCLSRSAYRDGGRTRANIMGAYAVCGTTAFHGHRQSSSLFRNMSEGLPVALSARPEVLITENGSFS